MLLGRGRKIDKLGQRFERESISIFILVGAHADMTLDVGKTEITNTNLTPLWFRLVVDVLRPGNIVSRVTLRPVLPSDSVHSWHLYSVAPLGYEVTSTMA